MGSPLSICLQQKVIDYTKCHHHKLMPLPIMKPGSMQSFALRLEHVCICSYILGTAVHHGSSGHAQWSPVNMQSFFIGASTLAAGGHSNALCVANYQPSFTVPTALTALTSTLRCPHQCTL